MEKRPKYALRFALVAIAAGVALFFVFQERTGRDVLRINISRKPTHIAVGQKSRLAAFEEFQEEKSLDAASAATGHEVLRAPINAKWSVSDPQVASISEDGTLTALKPGRVTVQTYWEGFKASTTVDVRKNLPTGVLPRIEGGNSRCVPQDVDLSLSDDRSLHFQLRFDGACENLTIDAPAPDQKLPWKFERKGVRLEIRGASGPIVSGIVSASGGREISFTTWSDGPGAYPLTLAGKTVLLVGDSMAEGLGWTMKGKVENAGGRLIVIPWFSSTTSAWAGEGRLKAEIARYNPDIIFIALGSNEIFLSQPELEAPQVRKLVSELGDIPAYWIGPPSWKPDHGIVRVIEDNFIPDRFYNSNDLNVPRRKDGAHPTVEGYATWSDLIWNWYARKV